MNSEALRIKSTLRRNLVFIHGKGGVGKTVVSQAVAQALAKSSHPKEKTLWVALEDPTRPPGEKVQLAPNLWHFNCDFTQAFEEYAALKIGLAPLTRIFLQNKLVRYLARAAPGIHELVLLGKIWHERTHYNHVVVDMPSTGYGMAMFQSTRNFIQLFHGGPLNRDASAMMETFQDSRVTGHLIVSLPEEMPLRESLELNEFLIQLFPKNPPALLVNRVFPLVGETDLSNIDNAQTSESNIPYARSAEEYFEKRNALEAFNLRIWRDSAVSFGDLEFVPPPVSGESSAVVSGLADQLETKAYL